MAFHQSYRLPIPILGVQLRGRHNPVLVALSLDPIVDVSIEVDESPESRLEVKGEPPLGWRGSLALRSFLDEVVTRLEQPLRVSIEYTTRGFHVAGLYAVLTYAIVEAVAIEGGYEMSAEEIARACNDIDVDAGVDLDYVMAARDAIASGSSLVWRRGEEPIRVKLEGGVVELVGEEELGEVIEDEVGDELHTVVSRLAGLIVVDASRAILESGWKGLTDKWRVLARLENSIYYMLFGVEPPPSGCKWTPGLQTVFGVCVEAGLGARVRVV